MDLVRLEREGLGGLWRVLILEALHFILMKVLEMRSFPLCCVWGGVNAKNFRYRRRGFVCWTLAVACPVATRMLTHLCGMQRKNKNSGMLVMYKHPMCIGTNRHAGFVYY